MGEQRINDLKNQITHLVTDMKHGVTQREACLKEYNKLADALKIISKEIHELEIEKPLAAKAWRGPITDKAN